MANLKIERCTESGGQFSVKGGAANTFEAAINPEGLSRNFGRRFTGTDEAEAKKCQAIGKASTVTKYTNPVPEKLSFSIVLDGTGAVPNAGDESVSDLVTRLRNVSYEFDGDEHEPPPCKVSWGQGLDVFYGRLTDLGVEYTLFKSDGTPLRARVKLDFIEAKTEAEESAEAKRKSPDMTHVIRVREGDTLPLLCQQVYKDVGKYLAVAKFNDLDNFRNLKPDTILRFPPMR